MLHICLRVPGQSFVEPSFEEEILAFIHFLGQTAAIKTLTDVEHKDHKKSNEMYYPRFTKVIIHHFMSKDPSIPRRNKFGALLPIELTNEEIKNSNAYKEYYAVATGAAPPKPKASNSTEDEGDNEGKDGDGDGDDDDNGDDGEDDDYEEGDDENDDEKDDEEQGGDVKQECDEEESDEEIRDEESFDPITKPLKIMMMKEMSSSVSSQFVTSMLNPTLDVGIESIFETTSQMDAQTPTSVAPLPMTAPTMTPSTISTITTTSQAPIPPTTAPGTIIQDLPNFGSLFSFNNRLRTLDANFSEFMQTNQFAGAVSAILGIVQQYMNQRMNEAVKVAIQIQSDCLRDEAQRENDEFLKTVDENMQKIIKEKVKEQVKTSYAVAADLSEMELKKILIEKIKGNKSIQRSDEQRNLYKSLVKAYESDKIILDTYEETIMLKRRRDDDADKDEEPSAGPDRGSKRRREGKEPESASVPKEKATRSAGKSTQGSKSRQALASESALAEEPMQTTFQMKEPSHLVSDTGAADQPIVQSSHHPEWFSQQQKPPTLDRDWNKTLSAIHGSIQPWISELAKQTDSRSSFNELMDTPLDFSNFLINQLKVDTLAPELLSGPTYELMKGSCKSPVELEYHLEEVFKATIDQLDWVNLEGQHYSHNLLKPLLLIPNNLGHRVIPFEHFINNDLKYLSGGASSRKYTTSITKTKATNYGHIKWIEDLVPWTMWIKEPIGYDKHALWGVSHWGRKQWHNYKHLDWITVQRYDDKLYKFKEGDFKKLRIQYIEDMLLLLVQGKLTNLTVEERFAFNVSLRMFTRSIVIQRHVEDLQLGVESYQKNLNLNKPDTYRSDLKHKEAYIAYSNPRGFIYQNKDKKNRLMRIDELHKFSDETLTDVRIAIDDRLKGIRMQRIMRSLRGLLEEGCTRETSGCYKRPYDLSYAAPIFQKISQSPRGIFINQSKYALESLKKYGFESCDLVDTPMVEKSKLREDKEGKAVDPSHYHDADHAGCQDTHRSTSGSLQFLGERLISWSSKRQKSAAISSTEAEYITL
nr:hypothetical protein [Tanacetum cinerariifolium]